MFTYTGLITETQVYDIPIIKSIVYNQIITSEDTMTLEDIKKEFGEQPYGFYKKTGMHHNSYRNWLTKGYVPIKTQIALERLTQGRLKASLEDLKVNNDA